MSNLLISKKAVFPVNKLGQEGWFWKCLGVVCLIVFNAYYSSAQSSFKPQVFESENAELPYQILFPENFNEEKKYPLVLFLHGAGERGGDNERQLTHGSSLFTNERNKSEFPALVVFPQCPKEDYWANVERTRNQYGEREFNFKRTDPPTASMDVLLSMIDSLAELSFIDQNRIYVMGLSMGGMGTFEIVERRPNLFAAAIPICGGGDPAKVTSYAGETNFWIFHGAKDDVVFPHYSVDMVLGLNQSGASPKFTLYQDANHNSWDPAFAEPDLFSWLFSQKKYK